MLFVHLSTLTCTLTCTCDLRLAFCTGRYKTHITGHRSIVQVTALLTNKVSEISSFPLSENSILDCD